MFFIQMSSPAITTLQTHPSFFLAPILWIPSSLMCRHTANVIVQSNVIIYSALQMSWATTCVIYITGLDVTARLLSFYLFRSFQRKPGQWASSILCSSAQTWVLLPLSPPQVCPGVTCWPQILCCSRVWTNALFLFLSLSTFPLSTPPSTLLSSWICEGRRYQSHRRLGGFSDSRCYMLFAASSAVPMIQCNIDQK